tara:strand:- start:780 stop:1223 length:444 start_codon:yes stop_codon:yes gene_type:complete
MSVNLPIDVIRHILSYGDPEVTIKHKAVINQLNYYKKEFNYLRHQLFNFYENWTEEQTMYFILNRNYFKVEAYGLICNCKTCINKKFDDMKSKKEQMAKWKLEKTRQESIERAHRNLVVTSVPLGTSAWARSSLYVNHIHDIWSINT